jgi:Flp pilus assembly protein TadG
MTDRNTPSKARKRGLLGRFRRASDGSVAVEFAIVSVPFFALLFAIIETALMFFVSQILDSAVTKVSRMIRTGQVQQNNVSAATFKSNICAGMFSLVDCNANLYVDVKVYPDFASYTPTSPIDPITKQMKPTTFQPGASGQIVVVRAFYAWPTFFDMLETSAATLADGRRLLGAVVAFRNEPFPW